MNIEETKVVEFLNVRPNLFVAVSEISRHLDRKRYDTDRNWALALLRRMELSEILESNYFGEYRLKKREQGTTTFRKALATPGVSLGDTAIVMLDMGDSDRSNCAG